MGCVSLLLALLAGSAPAQATWVVDAGGGGDFLEIADAVASPSVASGDRVLIVPAGYAPFTLARNLTLLGVGSQPLVTGLSTIQTPAGAVISNVAFQRLQLLDCDGVVILDRINVVDLVGLGCPTFLVQDCETVLAQLGVFRGGSGNVGCASEALVVRNSTVVVTQSVAQGGLGADDPVAGQDGRVAVQVDAGATVTLVHVNATGGAGGRGTGPGGTGGDGAPAVDVASGATAIAIGHDDSVLQGGEGGTGNTPGQAAQVAVSGSGSLTISGTDYLPPALDPALTLDVPDPPLSFVRMLPLADPPPDRRLQVFGDPGAFQWLLASLGSTAFELPGLVDQPLYLDPTVSFLFVPVVTLGLSNPVNFDFELPADPALVGLVASFQAFTSQAAGIPWRASNPAHIVVE